MKTVIALLLLAVFVISGCSSDTATEVVGDKDVVVEDKSVDVVEDEVIDTVTGTKLLVDKYKYISGGTDFDEAYQYYTVEAGKGYRITIESDKQVEVETMTEANCGLREKNQEYEVISTKQGLKIVFEGNPVEEKTNDCFFVKALENGQISSHVLVDELSF